VQTPRGTLQSLQLVDVSDPQGRRAISRPGRTSLTLGPAATSIILLLGVAISVLGWLVARREIEIEMARQTTAYASTLAHGVEAQIGSLYQALHRRAELWSDAQRPAEFWQPSVDLFLRENPSLLALAHSDPSRPMLGSAEGMRALTQLMPSIVASAQGTEGDVVIGPVMFEGRPLFGLRVKTDLANPPARVFAAFDPSVALHELLDERALGYGIRVEAGDRELFRRPASGAAIPAELAQNDSVSLGIGSAWTLSTWPIATTALSYYQQGPLLVLVSGLLASTLIAFAVHYGTLAWRRADALRDANLELARQIEETQRGQGDLRSLSGELEERVEQRTAELHETIVELETFNYSVSHDLRGPLGAVINFAAILREDYESRLDETARDILARIVRSATAAVSMMDALLAYSRSGRSELRKAPLDVAWLVREVEQELVAISPQYACALKIGDLPDVVADESMLRFIFSNLISNACKFVRPADSPSVEVGGRVSGGEAVFHVRDAGVGFDMRFAEKLFKVFERLHPSDEYPGHGVGLAIVARMVRRHGGRVWAQGAVGKGATFYFTIPVRDGSGDATKS